MAHFQFSFGLFEGGNIYTDIGVMVLIHQKNRR